jgi:hypothetical protein
MRINKKTILIFCCCLFLGGVLSCRATSKITPESVCPIEGLLIDAASLPGHQWEEIGGRDYQDAPLRLGIARLGTSFSTPTNGIVVEEVYRFCDVSEAIDGYNELSDVWFRIEPIGTTWSQLIIPEDVSIDADAYRLECSTRSYSSTRSCWYAARYEKTAVALKVDMIIIKDKDLFNLIEIINRKAKGCAEKEKSLLKSCENGQIKVF